MNATLFTFTAKGDTDPSFGAVGNANDTDAEIIARHQQAYNLMADLVAALDQPLPLQATPLAPGATLQEGDIVFCPVTFRRGHAYNVSPTARLCPVQWDNESRTTEICRTLLIAAPVCQSLCNQASLKPTHTV